MKPNPADCCDPKAIYVGVASKQAVKAFMKNDHYRKLWPTCPQFWYGVFKDRRLIGAVVYGEPGACELWKKMTPLSDKPLLEDGEILELQRLWIEDGHGKNIESHVIAQTRNLLKDENPKVKLLVSYADPGQRHTGRIYQADNWWFQETGDGKSKTYSVAVVSCPKPEDFKHSRRHRPEDMKKKYGKTKLLARPEAPKYRYVYFLRDEAQLRPFMKELSKNYPKQPRQIEPLRVV